MIFCLYVVYLAYVLVLLLNTIQKIIKHRYIYFVTNEELRA